MTLKKGTLSRVLITSAILITYLGGALHSTGEELYNKISTSDLGKVAITQTVQVDNSNNFLSSIFSIPQANADVLSDNGLDSSIYQKLSDIKGTNFEDVILKSYQKGIIKGYSDNTFKPNANVSFAESLKIIISAGPKVSQVQNYVTPTDSHWSDPFKALYNGQDKSTESSFTNDQKVTRDFSVYLMLRQIGVEFNQSDLGTLKIPNRFGDVNSSSKFAPYLAFAGYVGISSGYADGTFGGSRNITRGELTKMSYKTLIDNKDAIIQKYNDLKAGKVVPPVVSTVKSTQLNYGLDSNGNKVSVTYEKGKTYFKTAEEIKQFITQDKLVVSPDVYSKSLQDTLNPTGGLGGPRDGDYTRIFFDYVNTLKTSGKTVSLPTYLMPTFTDTNYKFGGQKAVNSTVIDLGVMSKVDLSSSPEIKTQAKNVEEVAKKMFPDYVYFNKSDYRGDTIRAGAVGYFRWDLMKDNDYVNLYNKVDDSSTKEISNKLTTEFYNLMIKEGFSSEDWKLVNSTIVYSSVQAERNLNENQGGVMMPKGAYLYQFQVTPSTLMGYGSGSGVKDHNQLEMNQTVKGTSGQTGVNLQSFLTQYILGRANF